MPKKVQLLTPGTQVPATDRERARKQCARAAKLLTKRNKLLTRIQKIDSRFTTKTGFALDQFNTLVGRVKRRQVAKALGYPK